MRCEVEGCSSCSADAAKCDSCAWGWRLDEASGTCAKCPEGCGECWSGVDTCDGCLDASWKLTKQGRCVRKRLAFL